MSTKKHARKDFIFKLVLLAFFTAIIFLMAFTPIGYLKVGPLSITFLVIPVAAGAMTLGPLAGAFLGAVFGLTSFLQAFGLDAFATTLFNINPLYLALTCFVPRILMGLCCGLIFKGLNKISAMNDKFYTHLIANLSAALLNTLFFMTTLILLFGKTDFIQGIWESTGASNILLFVIAFVGVNGLVEALTSTFVGTAVTKALSAVSKSIKKV